MMDIRIVQIFTGFVGSVGFGVLFNIHGKRLLMASLGGLLSWSLFLLFHSFIHNEPICYFLVAFLISLYAEVMARILKTPTASFILISLIPLIPGVSLYYTMANALQKDLYVFMQKAIATLQLASALALGIILSTAFVKLIHKRGVLGR